MASNEYISVMFLRKNVFTVFFSEMCLYGDAKWDWATTLMENYSVDLPLGAVKSGSL